MTELVEVESMHERKQKMADLSDAVIALPGLVLLLVFMPRLIRTEAIIINGKTFSLIILISRKTMNLL